MHSYSDAFVLSQAKYYKLNLNCGSPYNWCFILGLYQAYEAECRKRGML